MDSTLQVVLASSDALRPCRMSGGAAGFDLHSCDNVWVPARGRCLVSTGLRIRVPPGTYGRVAPRSGLAVKGIDVGAGVIDRDYTGIVKVLLINHTDADYAVNSQDRIAQLVLERIVEEPTVVVVDDLSETERGEGGFGSTGQKAL
jgi:dUTP pyrophosphatase